jgi:hypothetical protein
MGWDALMSKEKDGLVLSILADSGRSSKLGMTVSHIEFELAWRLGAIFVERDQIARVLARLERAGRVRRDDGYSPGRWHLVMREEA